MGASKGRDWHEIASAGVVTGAAFAAGLGGGYGSMQGWRDVCGNIADSMTIPVLSDIQEWRLSIDWREA